MFLFGNTPRTPLCVPEMVDYEPVFSDVLGDKHLLIVMEEDAVITNHG